MQEQKVRAIMKRIAACLLVLSLIFTMAGTGTFAAYADAIEKTPLESADSIGKDKEQAPEEYPGDQ